MATPRAMPVRHVMRIGSVGVVVPTGCTLSVGLAQNATFIACAARPSRAALWVALRGQA